MRINELFDLDNPLSAVDDVLSGASNLFTGSVCTARPELSAILMLMPLPL